MFCLYYLQRFNGTWAYMKAYGADYETARRNASRMLTNADIQKQLTTLKKDMIGELHVSAMDIANEYSKQAFSDIGDYIDFGTDDVVVRDGWFKPVKDKINGGFLTEKKSYVHLKNISDVDTSLIKKVHIGRDGVVVELQDKQKAQDALMKYFENNSIGDDEEQTVVVDDFDEGGAVGADKEQTESDQDISDD